MNTVFPRAALTGLLFLVIFLTGFWLARSGRPYTAALFNLHKLIALGAIVFLGILVARAHQAAPLQPVQVAAIVLAGICVLVTVITGGLANLESGLSDFVRKIHHVAPYLTLLSTGAALYLLLVRSAPLLSAR